MKKLVLFRLHFYMFISAPTKLSHTGQNYPKKFFCKWVSPILKCRSHRSYTNFLSVCKQCAYFGYRLINMRAKKRIRTVACGSKNGYCINSRLENPGCGSYQFHMYA